MSPARIALATLILSTALAAQTTWYVDDNATPPGNGTQLSPYASIQFAIARPTTIPGDTVLVSPGIYFERIDFLGKAITVKSAIGAAVTTIDAQALGSVAKFRSGEGANAVLEGFRLINGSGSAALGTLVGGGVFCSASSPKVRLCTIEACTATMGAGLGVVGGAPTIENCTLRQNTAVPDFSAFLDGIGGGVFLDGATGTVTIRDSVIELNLSDMDAPGVCSVNTSLVLQNVTIRDNRNFGPVFSFTSPAGGGLLSTGSGSVQATQCTISGNAIVGPNFPLGGGVAAFNSVSLAQCTIANNDAGDGNSPGVGGGVYGNVNAVGCSIVSNYGEWEGGGVAGGSFDTCTIQGNCSSTGGGAIGAYIEDSTIQGNYGCGTASEDFGGGAKQCTLVRCLVDSNFVGGHGGGALDSGLLDCIVRSNGAYAPGGGYSGSGGGVEGGSATGCQIYGNTTSGDTFGGGPEALGAGANGASLTRCVLYANIAVGGNSPSQGGGASNALMVQCAMYDNDADIGAGAWNCTLDRCTVVGNQAGLYSGGTDSSTLKNCILRANLPDQVNTCTVTYSDVQGGLAGTGNINANPMLWDEAARDFHLLGNSPCINTGDPTSPLDPDGSRADMGAYPFDPNYCPSPTIYCTAKTNSQGCVPQINYGGSATLGGADNFFVTAASVINQKSGLLFWGRASTAQPFQGGTKCVASPTIRTTITNSGGNPPPDDCSGIYSFHVSHAYMGANSMLAGNTIYAQWWTRDPASLPHLTGLTDALRFTICP